MTESITEREWLYSKVLGWTKEAEFYYKDADGNTVLDGTPFDPRDNIEQAFMLLDKFGDITLHKDRDVAWECTIWTKRPMWETFRSGFCDSKLDAIVNAVLSASGYKPHD